MSTEETATQEFNWLLDQAIEQKASDLHIMHGSAPMLRVDGRLKPVDLPTYTEEKSNEVVTSFIGQALLKKISVTRQELDFSFSYKGLRFRCNVFYQRGVLAGSIRLLPSEIADLSGLGLPPVVGKMLDSNQGLIIVSGPTGHGKSTTLAAMVNQIATQRRGHIVTIEDPVEYVFEHKKSLISQREIGTDTPLISYALRAVLREDPDVVMIGEMRDRETMEAALQIAETGHLVLTSLHTNSAAQTANRIIDVFPTHQQDQIRVQLSEVLLGVVSQRLLTRVQGGRVLASEIMLANSAVRALIRDGKTHQLPNLIQTSAAEGMTGLDKSLADLVGRGEISIDDAMAWSLDPRALKMMIY